MGCLGDSCWTGRRVSCSTRRHGVSFNKNTCHLVRQVACLHVEQEGMSSKSTVEREDRSSCATSRQVFLRHRGHVLFPPEGTPSCARRREVVSLQLYSVQWVAFLAEASFLSLSVLSMGSRVFAYGAALYHREIQPGRLWGWMGAPVQALTTSKTGFLDEETCLPPPQEETPPCPTRWHLLQAAGRHVILC